MKNQETLNREHIELLNRQIESIELHLEDSDYTRSPSSNIIVSNNWNNDDWRSIEDVLDRYDRDIEAGNDCNMNVFEAELETLMGIDYSMVKLIILAVSAEGRFAYVCRDYANHLNTSETRFILRNLKKNRCFK